jgi:hypothetical protein
MKNLSWLIWVFCLLIGAVVVTPGCTTTSNPTTTCTATTTSTTSTTSGGGSHNLTNLFFLHHSVGGDLIERGNVRATITAYNSSHGTSFAFWDQGYRLGAGTDPAGLHNAAGTLLGYDYYNGTFPDYTDPEYLDSLFTTDNYTRTQIMTNHQVIAFKSCFTASENLTEDTILANYKTYYLAMRSYFDSNTSKLFIVISPPPVTSAWETESHTRVSDRARSFANWLKSTSSGGFLEGSHPNIKCFDLFNYFARPDDGTATANTLQASFESGGSDNHPNETADQIVGPIFAQFLINSALSY